MRVGSQDEYSGNVVVLFDDRSYMQNKETNKKTRINYEQSQYVMYVRVPVKEGEAAKETEKVFEGNRFVILAAESEDHQGFTRRE